MVSLTRGLLIAALAFAAPFAFGQDMQGKDAPAFDASSCVNPPEATTLEQCEGDVVLIKWWGTG